MCLTGELFLPDFVRRSISFHAAGARARERYSAPPRPRSIRSASLTKHAAAHPSFIATKARSRSECSTMDNALAAADLTGPRGAAHGVCVEPHNRTLPFLSGLTKKIVQIYQVRLPNLASSLAAPGLPGQRHVGAPSRRSRFTSAERNEARTTPTTRCRICELVHTCVPLFGVQTHRPLGTRNA